MNLMDSKLSRLCDGILEAGWLFAIVATPLFFNIHTERVFEPDKLTLLRSIALFMALIWLVRFVDQRGWRQIGRLRPNTADTVWREPFVLPVVALVAVYLIATLFSVSPSVSWAGSYQRLQGTYTTFSYVVVFALMATTIRSRRQVRRVVTAVIVTSVPVSFYGLIQHYGLDPLPWGGDVTRRIAGHMGNSIFIAAYLIMAVPLTFSRILDAFTNILGDEELALSDVLRSAIYIFTLAIQLLAIYWSGSRGPLLGLMAGAFAFTLVLLVSLRNATPDRGSFSSRDVGLALLFLLPSVAALLSANAVAQTSSPLVAFGLFAVVVALSVLVIFLMVALRRGWKWLWLSWILLTAFMAGWLLLFNLSAARTAELAELPVVGGLFDVLGEWKELPTIGSYGRMLDPTQTAGRERSNRVRVLIWEGVVELLTPHAPLAFPDGSTDAYNFLRPLIGYGPESMYVTYNSFYPPELATVEARNASPDRAHNETFDALAITGLLGFIAWQAVYLSVFYFGFRFLGVVVSRRDSLFLIGAWVGGALIGALLALLGFGAIYFGVLVPTGSIVGLVIYLIYYALTARPRFAQRAAPFQTDLLLMNALVAAVLAYFVEIHFGIAVSVTRLHFFVFMALVYVLGTRLPRLQAEREPETRRGRGVAEPVGEGLWGPVILWTAVLALMVGIIGFEFTNYVLPPDKVVQTGADLTAGEIFRQSFFVNAASGFASSPFIYLLMVLSWGLGVLIVLSELVKHGDMTFDAGAVKPLDSGRRSLALAALAIMAVMGVMWRFLSGPTADTTVALGRSLALLWALLALWAAVRLFIGGSQGRMTAAAVGVLGLALLVPILVGGGWLFALLLGVLCAALLWLVWAPSWRTPLLAPLVLGAVSFTIGVAYTYFQAVLVREALLYLVFYQDIPPISTLYRLFFRPDTPFQTLDELRIAEAVQATRYLTWFYLYLFALLLAGGTALAWRTLAAVKQRGSRVAYGVAVVAAVVAIPLIAATNIQVAQADVVYKRGTPFDQDAFATGDLNSWDTAIAIYGEAIRRVPREDYYYLFLGRSLLERASVTPDPAGQEALLAEAEQRLLEAQRINPLNTDHTANLARLNTRWATLATDPGVRAERAARADAYYRAALALSPQNSVIRNEYGRLVLDLQQDCEKALAIYDESVAIDPFYVDGFFERAGAYANCARLAADPDEQEALFQDAVDSLDAGLAIEPENGRAWLRAGQIYHQLGLAEQALGAYDRAAAADIPRFMVPAWNLAFARAAVYADLGDTATALALAREALQSAPQSAVPRIEALIAQLGG